VGSLVFRDYYLTGKQLIQRKQAASYRLIEAETGLDRGSPQIEGR